MPQTKKTRKNLILGTIFGFLALFFALLYYFNFIKTFDLFLALTYVVYFAGLTLLFNGAYCKEKGYKNSRIISNLAGFAFIIASVALLIYGFVTGTVSFF